MAGSITPITIAGSTDGDFIVLDASGCQSAHLTTLSTTSLPKTTIAQRHASTHVNMTAPATLSICFATLESGGDSSDDFITLPDSFSHVVPIQFNPRRSVVGAPQSLDITDARVGDKVAWVRGSSCNLT